MGVLATTAVRWFGFFAASAVGLLSIAGCVDTTALPLYDRERDAIADPRLVGIWYAEGYDLQIGYGPEIGYLVRPLHFNANDPQFIYNITRIGERQYCFLTEYGKVGGGTVLTGASQLQISVGELVVRGLRTDVLRERLFANQDLLRYEAGRGAWTVSEAGPSTTAPTSRPATTPTSRPSSITLTDDPVKIRQYLIDHQDDPELFTRSIIVRRWLPVGESR